jgi:hypothetical protein
MPWPLPGFDAEKSTVLTAYVTKTRAAHVMAIHGYDELALRKLAERPQLTPDHVAYARSGPGTHARDLVQAAKLAVKTMAEVSVDDGNGGTMTITEQLAHFQTLFPEYVER